MNPLAPKHIRERHATKWANNYVNSQAVRLMRHVLKHPKDEQARNRLIVLMSESHKVYLAHRAAVSLFNNAVEQMRDNPSLRHRMASSHRGRCGINYDDVLSMFGEGLTRETRCYRNCNGYCARLEGK